jgi:hypothetical protein
MATVAAESAPAPAAAAWRPTNRIAAIEWNDAPLWRSSRSTRRASGTGP